MKHPSIFSGLIIALLLTIAVASASAGLTLILRPQFVLQVMIIAAVCGYGVALLLLAGKHVGRGISLGFLLCGQLALLFSGAGAIVLIVAGLLQLWLVRSLFFSRGVIEWIGDGLIVIAGFVTAVVLARHGYGLTGAVWGFLLVQSLFVLIAPTKSFLLELADIPSNVAGESKKCKFEMALRSAEEALGRIE